MDKSGAAIGKTYDWSKVGTWSATNPPDRVEIATSKNKNLIFDGALPTGIISNDDKWRSNFNLAYDTQKWSSHECANYKYKSPRVSNGHRHEYDLWCEFDC